MTNKMKQAAMDRVGELPIMMFDHIADASKMVRPRQTLREMCDAELRDWVNVPVAALRAALDALTFYAKGKHFDILDDSVWDTCSGEPQNLWYDENSTAIVEDGSIARAAIKATS